jgi:hypothetical protein
LLWLADAVNGIQGVAWGVAGCLAIGIGFTCFVGLLEPDMRGKGMTLLSKTKWVFVAAALVVTLPSPATIRALVAVKVGDYAVHSELGEKAIKALETVLDRVAEGKKD